MISSDPPCEEENAWFITIPFKWELHPVRKEIGILSKDDKFTKN